MSTQSNIDVIVTASQNDMRLVMGLPSETDIEWGGDTVLPGRDWL